MGFGVDLTEPLDADMGIDLGGAQIFMTQKLLDAPQIGTGIQQMCGKGVAQFMGRKIRGQSGKDQIFLQIALIGARRQAGT